MSGGHSFEFKQFKIRQDKCAMKVGTDAVLIGAWVKSAAPEKILDIGTGTGVIALMMAQKYPDAIIDAIDIDHSACVQAQENIDESPWNQRVHIHERALQAYNPAYKYNLIVSNPPYFINSSKAPTESRSNARHNDLLPFNELIEGVIRLLANDGSFFVILPLKEAELFIEQAQNKKLFLNQLMRVRTRADKSTEKRLMMQFEFVHRSFNEDMLIIEEDVHHSYTDQYKNLTRSFYKNF